MCSAIVLLFCGCSKDAEQAPSPTNDTPETQNAAASHNTDANASRPLAAPETRKRVPLAPLPVSQDAPSSLSTPPDAPTLDRIRSALAIDTQALREGIVERYALESLEDPAEEISYLLRKYEDGDGSVAIDLALLLAHSGKAPEQIDQARLILELAAENGDARAYSELARLVLLGDASQIDSLQAITFLEQAVAAHDPEGAYLLGVAHRLNLVPGSSLETGTEFLETAAGLGHPKAAIALFRNLEMLSKSADGSNAENSEALKERLADYPEMERWLIDAAVGGTASDVNMLANFFSYLGKSELSKETRLRAAQLGSFDALSALMSQNTEVVTNKAYRDEMKDLLALHVAANRISPTQIAEANYRLAYLHYFDGPQSRDFSLIMEHLQTAHDMHDYSAGIVLLKLQQGNDIKSAFVEAYRHSGAKAYSRYLELKREIQIQTKQSLPPYPTKSPRPSYPPEMTAEKIDGRVVLEAIIDENGKIHRPKVVESSHPSFESHALEALEKYEFEPALENGNPVASRIRLPIIFVNDLD